ncbi:MAG: hypothetical protein WC365_02640 [Candidatus Babeliales bacterium]|jgi:hypothetical protein
MQVKTLNLLVELAIVIMTFSTLYPMLDQNSMATSPFNPLASFLDFDESMPPFLSLSVDASTQTEEFQPQNHIKPLPLVDASTQTEEFQSQNRIESSLEPCISFLGGKYFFMLIDDFSSNMGKSRMCAYDLWNIFQGRQCPFLKRLIISLKNLGESNASFSIFCFDDAQCSIASTNISYQILDTALQKSYTSLNTLIRKLLANELIRIMLLIVNHNVFACAACAQPIFQNNQGLSYFTSNDILLLKCLHIYHLGCAKMPLNPKEEYRCPYCKIAIQSENDFVLYQKPI